MDDYNKVKYGIESIDPVVINCQIHKIRVYKIRTFTCMACGGHSYRWDATGTYNEAVTTIITTFVDENTRFRVYEKRVFENTHFYMLGMGCHSARTYKRFRVYKIRTFTCTACGRHVE